MLSDGISAIHFRWHWTMVLKVWRKTLTDAGADINAEGRVYGNTFRAGSGNGHENVVPILKVLEQMSTHRKGPMAMLFRQHHGTATTT